MKIYKYFYRSIQDLLLSLISKKNNFNKDLNSLIQKIRYEEIYDIGGSDGELIKDLDLREKKYFCFDIDEYNIKIGVKKYKKNKNIFFFKKSIDQIKLKNTSKKRIFIFKGVFHHLTDLQIMKFLAQLKKKDSVLSIDPFYHKNQKKISILLKKLDKGNYIRDLKGYSKILGDFLYKKKINYYLKFYSHIIFYKNVDKKIINKIF